MKSIRDMISQRTKVMGLPSILKHYKNLVARQFTAKLSTSKASTKTEAQKRGKLGEDLTAKELKKRGFRIISRNYRFSRSEIDLVAAKDDIVIFVEVKTRSKNVFFPVRALSFPQEKRIVKASKAFLIENGLQKRRVGYVYSLILIGESGVPEIHLRPFRVRKICYNHTYEDYTFQ